MNEDVARITIKEASPADLKAMLERLNRRMEERKVEYDIMEVIAMVNGSGNCKS